MTMWDGSLPPTLNAGDFLPESSPLPTPLHFTLSSKQIIHYRQLLIGSDSLLLKAAFFALLFIWSTCPSVGTRIGGACLHRGSSAGYPPAPVTSDCLSIAMSTVDVAFDGGAPVTEENTDESEQLFKGLSRSQRIQGYLLCLALSFFAMLMGWIAVSLGWYWKYTVLSALGSLMSIAGTTILMGPSAQLRYMFDETRIGASVAYLSTLFLSLFIGLATRSFFLCFLCGILQCAALTWYSLSYVPYAREAVLSFVFRR